MSLLKPKRESDQKGTKKCQYSIETLMETVGAVQSNRLSVCRAADVCGIGKSTISNHVNKRVNKVQLGPTPYLGDELEQRLYQWLIKMVRIRYGQFKSDLFDRIQTIVK